jgi:hypothetical protein
VEYEHRYQGRRIIVTTKSDHAGRWAFEIKIVDGEERIFLADGPEDIYQSGDLYPSEEKARQAAFSAAGAAIDRSRTSRGKP